jgi:outer membrane lipoprotein SlyB
MKHLFMICVVFIISHPSLAGTNNLQFVLSNGDTLSQLCIVQLDADAVEISHSGRLQWVAIDSIAEIRHIKRSKFWKGAGIGLLGGAFAGGVIGRITYKEDADEPDSGPGPDFNLDIDSPGLSTFGGAFLGALAGTLVGATVGAYSGKDDVYNLFQKEREEKREVIQTIIEKTKKR